MMPKLVYLNAISKNNIASLEDMLKDGRLIKHLWIELMLNSEMVRVCMLHLNDHIFKEAVTIALSWYLGFRWLIPENEALEEIHRIGVIKYYPIKGEIYRLYRRDFLKGILHVRLC